MNRVLNTVGMATLLVVLMAGMVFAAKPAGNPAGNTHGAQTYQWYLSGQVMPVPPYGLHDIPGSNTASKLIVNTPNGNVIGTTITGVMNGLQPYTTYTVYISNPYAPYVATGWSISGTWIIDFYCNSASLPNCAGISGPWIHSASFTQNGDSISGTGGYTGGGTTFHNTWEVMPANSFVSGNAVNLDIEYLSGDTSNCEMTMNGIIASDGSMSGTWSDNCHGGRSGTWSTSSGSAVVTHTGNTYWTGQLAGTTPFTFTTDSSGSGSWHVNLPASLSGQASVWINSAGGTILVSNDITIG